MTINQGSSSGDVAQKKSKIEESEFTTKALSPATYSRLVESCNSKGCVKSTRSTVKVKAKKKKGGKKK